MRILWILVFSLFSQGLYAQSGIEVKDTGPFVLGYTEKVYSDILDEERVLNVYLPDGYDTSKRYPVIYLLDGSANEDFIHIVGLVQFNNFSWIDRVPKSIVVGIANKDRKRDFTYPSRRAKDKELVPTGGGSARFINFIEQEVQPFINGKYATNDEAMLIGQSLGGLLATEILMTRPMMFDKYIIISPSLWWDDGGLLSKNSAILEEGYDVPIAVYIGVGREGSIDGSAEHVMERDAQKLAAKISAARSKNIKVYFDYLPDENHATVTHQAVFNALRLLYPKKD